MRVCTKCLVDKDFSDFHKKGSGYRSICKDCRKLENPVNRVRSRKWYRNNHERALQSNKDWKQNHKKEMMEYKNNWRSRNKKKALAHWAVSNALRSGKLLKQPCESCGSSDVQAHHQDYDRQLDVSWLCDYHHKERHGVLINA